MEKTLKEYMKNLQKIRAALRWELVGQHLHSLPETTWRVRNVISDVCLDFPVDSLLYFIPYEVDIEGDALIITFGEHYIEKIADHFGIDKLKMKEYFYEGF